MNTGESVQVTCNAPEQTRPWTRRWGPTWGRGTADRARLSAGRAPSLLHEFKVLPFLAPSFRMHGGASKVTQRGRSLKGMRSTKRAVLSFASVP